MIDEAAGRKEDEGKTTHSSFENKRMTDDK